MSKTHYGSFESFIRNEGPAVCVILICKTPDPFGNEFSSENARLQMLAICDDFEDSFVLKNIHTSTLMLFVASAKDAIKFKLAFNQNHYECLTASCETKL